MAELLCVSPKIKLMQALGKLTSLETFKMTPWPETVEEYQQYHVDLFASRWATDLRKEEHRMAFRKYHEVKLEMTQPRKQKEVKPSKPKKRRRLQEDAHDSEPEKKKRAKVAVVTPQGY